MNEPATPLDAPASQTEELQAEVQSLGLMLCVALILMMVFGACVDCYLLKQISNVRSATRQAQTLWEAVNITKAVYFWNALTEYEKTHPDLRPLMTNARQFANQTLLNPAYMPQPQKK